MSDKQLPRIKNYTGQQVNWIQGKLDGHYTKVVCDSDGIVTVTSKKPTDITEKILEIERINMQLSSMPRDSIILCELHCPELDATQIVTLINAADERLLLTVFAVPRWDGHAFDKQPRGCCDNFDLEDWMIWLAGKGFDVVHALEATADFVDKKGCDALNELAIWNGFEGHVLKVSHMEGWFKLKPVRELDAFVTDTQMSVSDSYYGMLKGVRLAIYKPDGTEWDLGNCGIGQMEIKLEYDTQEKRDALIGRIVEVHYDKIECKGGMRFPRFIRWRDDEKEKSECTTEQFHYYKGKDIG